MLQEILQRIVDPSVPARLPGPWNFLDPVPSVRSLDCEPSALVASLLSQFSQEELVNEQILSRVSEAELRLAPKIVVGAPFKVLSRQKDGAPFDFENQQGRLTDGDPAALRCLDDHLTRERSARRTWVLATLSNGDLAVLSMLGLPATTACGLSNITADQARHYLTTPKKTIGVPPPPVGSAQLPEGRPRIILAATELFALRNQMPSGSLNAAEQLRRVERTMKIDTSAKFGIWLPTQADFRRIRDGVALADRQLVRDAIKQSVQKSESIEHYFKSTSVPEADDVPRARKKLCDAINSLKESTLSIRDLPARLQALNSAIEIAIVGAANHEAMVADDPLVRSLWIVAAELMEMQFESSALVQRASAAIAMGRAVTLDIPVEDRLQVQLRLAEGLIRIKKAIAMSK